MSAFVEITGQGASTCILQLAGAGDWDPWLDQVAFQASWLGGAAGYAPQLSRVTQWIPCLGRTTGCVQQSNRDIDWVLLLGTFVGWTPWLARL